MEKLLLEAIQKDIEVFTFSLFMGKFNQQEVAIYSSNDFEISSIYLVAKIMKKRINNDTIEKVLNFLSEEELNPKILSQTIFNIIKKCSDIELRQDLIHPHEYESSIDFGVKRSSNSTNQHLSTDYFAYTPM